MSKNITITYQKKRSPKIVHNYMFGNVLGSGSKAKVREAINQTTHEHVAIKKMSLSLLQTIPNGVESVKKEIATMQNLNHKNIMGLIEVFDFNEKGIIYIVLELVNGGTLSNFIDSVQQIKKKKIPITQVRSLFSQLILALEHCHSKLVVHRDVKPSNILLMTDGTLKLSDFGEAEVLKKEKNDNLTSSSSSSSSMLSSSSMNSGKVEQTNKNMKSKEKETKKPLIKNYSIDRLKATNVGSPYFQCPEISRDETVSTFKADVFAAGVTLYKMITSEYPFNGSDKFVLYKNIQNGEFTIPEYFSEELKDLMNGLLHNKEKKRLSIQQVKNHPWMTMELHDDQDEEWFTIPEFTPKYEDEKDEVVQSLIPEILNSNSDDDDDDEYNSETGSSSDLSDGYYVSNINKNKNKDNKKNDKKKNNKKNDDDDDDLSCCTIL
ncbi:serine/threonine-protein kinase stk11 [Anaeramoeba flamelloides]|uniref:Serine/threonine-protein kinase stk11 n=1 Tax=Anaeramoeba flamelloides TaxID=1746091 RepID=A0ABQ8XA45_9EUKA|nr:serine/threonine-protein kinase stk11 [Anaeramoeba flamelloides]